MNRTYIGCQLISGQLFGKIGCKDKDGFTLLEVVVAIALLGITLVPLMGFFLDAVVIHVQREEEIRAAFLAQQKMEEVKIKATYNFAVDRSEGATAFPTPDSEFKYIVTDHIDPDFPDIKEIKVEVWYDEDGDDTADEGEQQMELNTKVARRR